MSTGPSDAVMASATVLEVPRLRGNQSHTMGDSSLQSPDHILGPQPAASMPPQGTDDIDNSSPQAEGVSSNPQLPRKRTNKLPVMIPYSTAYKIPYLRKLTYIFPDAISSISEAHQSRYHALEEIFRKNIESSPKLVDCNFGDISYELRMCGSCETDAIPSIVIYCPSKFLKKIKSLLTQPHIRYQFEPEIPTPTLVRFGLFFWGCPIEYLASHDIAVVIPEEQDSIDPVVYGEGGSLPWGLKVLGEGHNVQRTATIGCIIQVGNDQFGLTAAHAFDPLLPTASRDYPVDNSDSDTDDEEYDMSMDCEIEDVLPMEKRPISSDEPRGWTVQLEKCQVHITPPLEDTSTWTTKHADLDWALIELGWNKNGLSTDETIAEALPIVECLPQGCTNVKIITQSLPTTGIPAIMYNIPSYIGGAKGSPTAEVWTVRCLYKENFIQKGQSGSLVVDAVSGDLYGMVLAVNPFGDVHIAPFPAILAQVKELFNSDHAHVLRMWRRTGYRFVGIPETHKESRVIQGDITRGSMMMNGPIGRENLGVLQRKEPEPADSVALELNYGSEFRKRRRKEKQVEQGDSD